MNQQRSTRQAAATHNREGCPYLNQTGEDAVQGWASVLTGIDLTTLPTALQAELRQLQLKSGAADFSATSL